MATMEKPPLFFLCDSKGRVSPLVSGVATGMAAFTFGCSVIQFYTYEPRQLLRPNYYHKESTLSVTQLSADNYDQPVYPDFHNNESSSGSTSASTAAMSVRVAL